MTVMCFKRAFMFLMLNSSTMTPNLFPFAFFHSFDGKTSFISYEDDKKKEEIRMKCVTNPCFCMQTCFLLLLCFFISYVIHLLMLLFIVAGSWMDDKKIFWDNFRGEFNIFRWNAILIFFYSKVRINEIELNMLRLALREEKGFLHICQRNVLFEVISVDHNCIKLTTVQSLWVIKLLRMQ